MRVEQRSRDPIARRRLQTFLHEALEPSEIPLRGDLANVVMDAFLDPPVPFGTRVGIVEFLCLGKGDQPVFLAVAEEDRDCEAVETLNRINRRNPESAIQPTQDVIPPGPAAIATDPAARRTGARLYARVG